MNNNLKNIIIDYKDYKTGIKQNLNTKIDVEFLEELLKEQNIKLEVLRELMEIYYEYNDKICQKRNNKQFILYITKYSNNTNIIDSLVYYNYNSMYDIHLYIF